MFIIAFKAILLSLHVEKSLDASSSLVSLGVNVRNVAYIYSSQP